ncbi:MAG: hypothetical protein H0X39_16810 [Actinobacteria bacterium]|nr:hypothetical protein [Actinomycetota bacterium]
MTTLPSVELVAHEEAHVAVARWVGWEVIGITYGKRGGSGKAEYLRPAYDLNDWRELYVTLAGIVSDAHHYGDDPEYHVALILKKARRIEATGFAPVREDDHWKAARILVAMSRWCRDATQHREEELRAGWAEVQNILSDQRRR